MSALKVAGTIQAALCERYQDVIDVTLNTEDFGGAGFMIRFGEAAYRVTVSKIPVEEFRAQSGAEAQF